MNEPRTPSRLYILDTATQSIRFTKRGIRELAEPFFQAGIDVHTIKTFEQYDRAMRNAMPYVLSACIKMESNPHLKKLMQEFRDLLFTPRDNKDES